MFSMYGHGQGDIKITFLQLFKEYKTVNAAKIKKKTAEIKTKA